MRLSVVIAVLLGINISVSATAQNSAHVTGVAYHPYEFSEVIVPGTRIIFKAENIEREAIADKQGRYEINLPEAVYHITGSLPGFCPINRPNVPIKANTEIIINIRLVICGIADGEAIDKDGRSISPRSWIISPVESETRLVNEDSAFKEVMLFQFANRKIEGNRIEYRGSFVNNYNISAAAIFRELAIYADLIVLDDKSLRIQATGHVFVEDGRKRRKARFAMLDLGSTNVISTLEIEGEENTEIGRPTSR